MNDKRPTGWGKKVMGLFVESDEPQDPTAPSMPAEAAEGDAADALIRKYAGGGDGGEPTRTESARGGAQPSGAALTPVVGGKLDFGAVYEAGGVTQEARDRIQKAQELLRSLPAETPVMVKRQIVEAALKAFGVPIADIVTAAQSGVAALDGHVRAGQGEVEKLLTEGAARIAELEAEITSVRQIMQQAVTEQEARTRATAGEKAGLSDVLGFFGAGAGAV